MALITRCGLLGLGLTVILLALSCGGGGGDQAQSDGPRVGAGSCPAPCMELSIPDGDCTDTWPAVHCTVSQNEPFSLKIIGRVNDPSQIGAFATLVYLEGLAYNGDCASDEILFQPTTIPLCGISITGAIGHGNSGIGSPFASWENAPDLVELKDIECTAAGTFDVVLPADLPQEPSPRGASTFLDVNASPVRLNLSGYEHEINDAALGPITVEVADVLTVECV